MSSKYFVTIFVDTGDKTEEWTEWAKEHTADLMELPGFTASRAYRVRDDYKARHPETFDSQPPYDLMTYYEVDEEGLEFLTTWERPVGDPPAGNTRDFPTPLGKNVGHAFLWEAIQDENSRPEAQS